MMANTHCAQCSDTRNIYIKTCDCSKEQVKQDIDTKIDSIKKEFNNSSAVDQKKKQSEEPKIKAVKAVLYRVVRVYETVPSKTMKIVGALTLLLLIVAVFSVALAQNKEETKSQYGMAFPLEDNAPVNSDQKVSIIGSVPGEGQSQSAQESSSESPVTTTFAPTTDESPMTTEDSEKKLDDIENQGNENPTLMITNSDDEEEKSGENGEEKTNPRLVFIERLMGLHLSGAPFNGQPKEDEKDENSAIESEPQLPFRTPFDNVNAKWATRMRKFSIPLMQPQQAIQPPETPNPLLRVAAAAMMTRLLAAAARAHQQGPMMGKDKDDDAEEETVPVLLATMRSDDNDRDEMRPMPPMYGRPMPRPQIMRPPVRPPIKFVSQPQQRMASIPQRSYASQMIPQRGQVMQRALPPVQPVLVMLAHVPVPMQMAESRMGGQPVQYSPYYSSQQQSMPIYPQSVPYSVPVGYHPFQRHITVPVEVPTPVHVPVPVASYQRPVYQSAYQSGPTIPYQRQSVSRPVIEIPIEIPVPVHVPVPVSYGQGSHQHEDPDHDSSASEAEHVAILYVDPEGNESHNEEGSDHMEPQTSESNENTFHISPQKGFPFMSRPLPNTQSATKLKLWREYIGAKHAAQPGVRYIPVAVSSDDSQPMNDGPESSDSHVSVDQNEPTAESQSHPAFVILSDEGPDAPQHH